jgi:hypothetical protein
MWCLRPHLAPQLHLPEREIHQSIIGETYIRKISNTTNLAISLHSCQFSPAVCALEYVRAVTTVTWQPVVYLLPHKSEKKETLMTVLILDCGEGIKGECRREGYVNKIDVLSYSHGIAQPITGDPDKPKRTAGKPNHHTSP